MKVLQPQTPTPEQLKVIQDYKPGVLLIRGAAGSGKTTTALLRIRFLLQFWSRRQARLGTRTPVKTLVLTYNKTLSGYIHALVEEQVSATPLVEIEVTTFAKWAKARTRSGTILNNDDRSYKINTLAPSTHLSPGFLVDEVDYILGRFLPDDIYTYLTAKREGRGKTPRIEQSLRMHILENIIAPYCEWKQKENFSDWNDLAVQLALKPSDEKYDVVVVDEAQDFSANETRAIMNHLAGDHSLTFVLDAAQRIYPRHFTWPEIGVSIQSSYRLSRNYRNTAEIAAFAAPLVSGLDFGDDGTLPDLKSCDKHDRRPIVVIGRFNKQVDYAISDIKSKVDLRNETVAFLHAKGGTWFDYLRERLHADGLGFVEIARNADWPDGPENIALSTMHSAKGLEFDYVYILGLSAEVTRHGDGPEDAQYEGLRRLLAMAVARARRSLVIGYKPSEASSLVKLFNPSTFDEIRL